MLAFLAFYLDTHLVSPLLTACKLGRVQCWEGGSWKRWYCVSGVQSCSVVHCVVAGGA